MISSYYKTYLGVSIATLLGAVAINCAIDPLWYGKGNIINGRNFSFNERISKTNLFLQTKGNSYDCLILGSSRVTLLRASSFKSDRCFNYSFSAGNIDEFVEYAKYVKEKGFNPKKVYVGVDAFNFDKATWQHFTGVEKIDPQPIYKAYFSLDVLFYSTRTLLGMSPDPRYYDRQFESELIDNLPAFRPKLLKHEKAGTCDASKVKSYEKLRQVFPQAEFIGYVPPISAWNVVNEVYSRGLTDCYLSSIEQVSKIFDVMYDFSAPSFVTTEARNTYDGSHFKPDIQEKVSETIQTGKTLNFGIRIDKNNLFKYENIYKLSIKKFLEKKE